MTAPLRRFAEPSPHYSAAAGARIENNPFAYPLIRDDGVSEVAFIGTDHWELWREGFTTVTPGINAPMHKDH